MSTRKNTRQKEKKHSKIDGRYLLKTFSICLITFVIGIFIGKLLTPSDSVQDIKKRIKQGDPNDRFTFFETLSNKKSNKSLPREMLNNSAKMSPQKTVPPSKNHLSKKNSPSQKTTTVSHPRPASAKNYTIQVGAFQTKSQAEQLIQRLEGKGYSAFLNKADLGNKGIWYRVRVGRYSSIRETKKQLLKLSEKTGLKGFAAQTQ